MKGLIEMKIKVGYLGPDSSTFGYVATEKYFKKNKKDIDLIPFKTHLEICEMVGKGEIVFGTVAIENVVDGPVTETIHAVENVFRKYGLCIYAEEEIRIELFYLQKATKNNIDPKKVLSHMVALRQCSRFISSLQDRNITIEVRSSTGGAAKEASENCQYAVLASKEAEQMYKLKRLVPESVTNNRNNFTRFWILGKQLPQKTNRDKTCILVNLDQAIPGTLYKALGYFVENKVNLLIVYPNPIRGRKWEYTFVIELAGHIRDENISKAYDELAESGLCPGGPLLLGSYPMAQ